MGERKLVRPTTKSSRWAKWGNEGSEGVPCSCLEYVRGQRYGTLDKCSGGSGAYYGSSCGNEGRQPSSECDSQGVVHCLGSELSQVSRKGVDRQRYGG